MSGSGYGISRTRVKDRVTETHARTQQLQSYSVAHLRTHKQGTPLAADLVYPDGLAEDDFTRVKGGYAAFMYASSYRSAPAGSQHRTDAGGPVRTTFPFFNGAPRNAEFAFVGIYRDSEGSNPQNDKDAQGAVAYSGETELLWTGFGVPIVDEPFCILPPNPSWTREYYDTYIKACNPSGKGSLALGHCVMLKEFLLSYSSNSAPNPHESLKNLPSLLRDPLQRLNYDATNQWQSDSDVQDASSALESSSADERPIAIASYILTTAKSAEKHLALSEDRPVSVLAANPQRFEDDIKAELQPMIESIFEKEGLFTPMEYDEVKDIMKLFRSKMDRTFAHWMSQFNRRIPVIQGFMEQAANYQHFLGALVTAIELRAVALLQGVAPDGVDVALVADQQSLIRRLGLGPIFMTVNTFFSIYTMILSGGLANIIRNFYCGRIMAPMNSNTKMVSVTLESKAHMRI